MRVKWNRNLDGGTVRQTLDGSDTFDDENENADADSLTTMRRKEVAVGLPPATPSSTSGFLSSLFRMKRNRRAEDDQSLSSLSPSMATPSTTSNFERRVSLPARWKRRPPPAEGPFLRREPSECSPIHLPAYNYPSVAKYPPFKNPDDHVIPILTKPTTGPATPPRSESLKYSKGKFVNKSVKIPCVGDSRGFGQEFTKSATSYNADTEGSTIKNDVLGDTCQNSSDRPQQKATLTKSASLSECQPQDIPTSQTYSSFSQSNKSLGPTAERPNLFHTAKSFFSARAKSIIKKSGANHGSDISMLKRSSSVTDYHSSKCRNNAVSTSSQPTVDSYESRNRTDSTSFYAGLFCQQQTDASNDHNKTSRNAGVSSFFSNLRLPGKKTEQCSTSLNGPVDKSRDDKKFVTTKVIEPERIHNSETFKTDARQYDTSSINTRSSSTLGYLGPMDQFTASQYYPQLDEPDILEKKSRFFEDDNITGISSFPCDPIQRVVAQLENKLTEISKNDEVTFRENGFADPSVKPGSTMHVEPRQSPSDSSNDPLLDSSRRSTTSNSCFSSTRYNNFDIAITSASESGQLSTEVSQPINNDLQGENRGKRSSFTAKAEDELTCSETQKPDYINAEFTTDKGAKGQVLRIRDFVVPKRNRLFADSVSLHNTVHKPISPVQIVEENSEPKEALLLFNGSVICHSPNRDSNNCELESTKGNQHLRNVIDESETSSRPSNDISKKAESAAKRERLNIESSKSEKLLSDGKDVSGPVLFDPPVNEVTRNCQISPQGSSSVEEFSISGTTERVFSNDTLRSAPATEICPVEAGRIKNGGESTFHDDEAFLPQQVTEGRFSSGLIHDKDEKVCSKGPQIEEIHREADVMTNASSIYKVSFPVPVKNLAFEDFIPPHGTGKEFYLLSNQEEIVHTPPSKICVEVTDRHKPLEIDSSLGPSADVNEAKKQTPVSSDVCDNQAVNDRTITLPVPCRVSENHADLNSDKDCCTEMMVEKDGSVIDDTSPIRNTVNGYLNAVFSEVQLQCSLLKLEANEDRLPPSTDQTNVGLSDENLIGSSSQKTEDELSDGEIKQEFLSDQVVPEVQSSTRDVTTNLNTTSKSICITFEQEISEVEQTVSSFAKADKDKQLFLQHEQTNNPSDPNVRTHLKVEPVKISSDEISPSQETTEINEWIERISRKIQETSEICEVTEPSQDSRDIQENMSSPFGTELLHSPGTRTNFYNSSPDLNGFNFDHSWSTRNRYRMHSGNKAKEYSNTLPSDTSTKRITFCSSGYRGLDHSQSLVYPQLNHRVTTPLSKSKSDEAIPYRCNTYSLQDTSESSCMSYINPVFEDNFDVDMSDDYSALSLDHKRSTWYTDVTPDVTSSLDTMHQVSSEVLSDDLSLNESSMQDVSIGSGEAMWCDHEENPMDTTESLQDLDSHSVKETLLSGVGSTDECDFPCSLVDAQGQTSDNYECVSGLLSHIDVTAAPEAVGQVRCPATETTVSDQPKRVTLRPSVVPGKSRIPKKQTGGTKPLIPPRPVRPPMWLSKAELSQEIQHLSTLCESRTKELNKLKLDTKHVATGFDALAVVIRYLSTDLQAFQNSKLAADLKEAQEKLNQGRMTLSTYETEVSKLKTEHSKEIEQMSETLNIQYEERVKDMTFRQKLEVKGLKEHQEKELSILKEELKSSCEEERLQLERIVDDLKQELRKQREELEIFHQHELDDLEERMLEKQQNIQAELEKVQKQYDDMKFSAQTMEEALNRDTDSKLQWISSKKGDLQNEVDSLKAVLEIKNNELHALRKENLEMQKELEELPLAREKIKMLQARAEDLKALMVEKVQIERRLSTEHQSMKEIFHKETKVNERLSMENEELQWKLKQALEASLLATSIPDENEFGASDSFVFDSLSQIDIAPEDVLSPIKSPRPSSSASSRTSFFTYMNQEEMKSMSPQSPRNYYKRIQSSPNASTGSVKLFGTPRKTRGNQENSSQSHEGTPCKVAKHISSNSADNLSKRHRASSVEGRVLSTNVVNAPSDGSCIAEDSSFGSSDGSPNLAAVQCEDNIQFQSGTLESNQGWPSSEEGTEDLKKESAMEEDQSDEVIDPKTFYHMAFPVFKDSKTGGTMNNEDGKSAESSPNDNECDTKSPSQEN